VLPIIGLSLILSFAHAGQRGSGEVLYIVVVAVIVVVLGAVRWLVTRWRIEGDTLRIAFWTNPPPWRCGTASSPAGARVIRRGRP
jgi:hypothetical protein